MRPCVGLLLLLALGIAAPAVFVAIGLKRVMRPVEELKTAVQEVARGNFTQTISVTSGDEIEELATEFNLMAAEQLQGSYAALSESEELYRAVVETALDAMSITVGTEQVFVNNSWLKLMGVERPEVDTIILGQYIAPEDRDKVVQRNLARQRGEPVEDVNEFQILRNYGQRRTVQASAVAINYKDQPASLAILRDVTGYKRAQAELQALFNISSILGQPGTFEDRLNDVLGELQRIADAAWVTLRAADLEKGELRAVVRAGGDLRAVEALHDDESLAFAAMESGQPLVANDYVSHPKANPSAISLGAKSAISLPVNSGGECIAVVIVVSQELNHFDPERVRLLTSIVDGLGPILRKARLDSQIRDELERRRQTEAQLLQRSQELEALFKNSSILNQPGTFEQKINNVTQDLARVAEADWVTLRIPDSQDGELGIVVRVGRNGNPLPGSQAPSVDALTTFETGEPLVINDFQTRPVTELWTIVEGARSAIFLPIKGTEETLAVASVISRELDYYNPDRVRLLTTIADGIGTFLETARLDGQIREELERRRQTEAQLLQRSEELEALFKISNILNQPGTYADKLNGVMQELLRIADADWMKLLLPGLNENGLTTTLVSLAAGGKDLPSITELQQRPAAFAMEAMESGESIVENDYQSRPDTDPRAIADGLKSLIALPIKGTEGTLSVASVASRQSQHFNPERVRLLTAIVDGFGNFLEKARLDRGLIDSNRQLSEALDVLKAIQEHVVQQERLHALGTMASGIAHDFNNALAPVLGYSELILEDADRLDESTVKFLREISTSAKDAGAVVGRLREFYRAREGSELMVAVDINGVVARVISLTQPRWRDMAQANGLDIRLSTQLADDLAEVSGDESELRTALSNVIFNAVYAMPDGGAITLRTFQDGEDVVLEVIDTGIGMSDEVLRRAMEPFFTTKRD